MITRAVDDELLRGASKHAQLYQVRAQEWIGVVDDSSIAFLELFSVYHARLGGGGHNIGESATLAYAELHGMTACIDDRVARRQGQERGVTLTGTLELVCRGIRANAVGEEEAVRIVDLLRDHEAFLPCDGSTFLDWARAEGLLSWQRIDNAIDSNCSKHPGSASRRGRPSKGTLRRLPEARSAAALTP